MISYLSCQHFILTSFEAISFLANSAGDAYAAMVLRLIIGNAERREKAAVESVSFAIRYYGLQSNDGESTGEREIILEHILCTQFNHSSNYLQIQQWLIHLTLHILSSSLYRAN